MKLHRTQRQQLAQVLQYYVDNRPVFQRALTAGFVVYIVFGSLSGIFLRSRKTKRADKHAAIDVDFYERLFKLLRIVIPSTQSKEALMLAMHSGLLVFRTALSLYVAALDGKIVSALVKAKPKLFLWNIMKWLLVAIPATWTNSWLSYVQNKLAIAYRTKLTKAVLDRYLGETHNDQSKLYYRLVNLDDRIQNPDQMITVDIQRFSVSLAAVYSNLAKPILDVAMYNYQLSKNVGVEGLIILTGLVQVSASLLRWATPPFGRYTNQEAELSGKFHYAHSRFSEYAEEIAFLEGEETERTFMDRNYFKLVKHIESVLKVKMWHGTVEEGIIKWLWGSLGLCLCAVPTFFNLPGISSSDLGVRTEGFVTNRRLLLSASDAFGRVMYSYKELSELAGYTSRVSFLLDTMEDVQARRFIKTMINNSETIDFTRTGQIKESDEIEFNNVPVITPNGDILVKKLSFHVKPGQHLLIVGPNGCGKSSLFRILGGLWPVRSGVVHKPKEKNFILIPQRPYLSLGTLRDQVIYPHSKLQMEHKGLQDADLLKILSVVELSYIVEREGGWNTIREWRDTLSSGDKQKMAWARLFYHAPQYAILDEATSLIPIELEAALMNHATVLGITLLTVSHRPSLWKYHSLILHYDGSGGYVFTKLNAEERLKLQQERQDIEARLLDVPKMKERLAELQAAAAERYS